MVGIESLGRIGEILSFGGCRIVIETGVVPILRVSSSNQWFFTTARCGAIASRATWRRRSLKGARAWRAAVLGLAFALSDFSAPLAAGANPLTEGFAAFENGETSRALEIWLPLARNGELLAQVYVGALYVSAGAGVADYPQALYWTRKAAERGNAAAQHNLAMFYERGIGIPRDFAQALAWYLRSANQGNSRAQWRLGVLYATGQGTSVDYDEAALWTRKAAEQGEPEAQADLGNMYRLGQGLPQDAAKALNWYKRAADAGYDAALNNLGMMLRLGAGTSPDYRLAREYFDKAAAKGVAEALYNLGSMDILGQGSAADPVSSYAWFTLAAERALDASTKSQAERNINLLTSRLSSTQIQDATAKARRWAGQHPRP